MNIFNSTNQSLRATKRPDGGTTYAYSYRDAAGRAKNVQATIYSNILADHIRAQSELIERVENSSLKSEGKLFSELVDSVVKKNGGGGQPWVYDAIKKNLGMHRVGPEFLQEYHDYIEGMEGDDYSHNTIQHHKSAIRATLNHAYQRGSIDSIPIRKWDISFKFRSRIWNSDQERTRFFNKLVEKKSHLYWSMVLLEKRPIRARSDLWRLTNANLELFGEGAPYLHFLAKKTDTDKNKSKKETFIPLHGLDDVLDYLKHGRPVGCELLFPRVEHTTKSAGVHDFEFMRSAEWAPMGIPKRHFNYICDEAQIADLHIHDFKHMAIKHMIEDERYTIEQLTAFGIQFDDKLIKNVYWQQNAIKMMDTSKRVTYINKT